MNTPKQIEKMLFSFQPVFFQPGNRVKTYCKGEWDALTCWPNSLPGFVDVPCPKYIVDFDHTGKSVTIFFEFYLVFYVFY